MKLSVIQTINNRTEEVCKAVSDSFRLPGNQPDEMIIVMDRPAREIQAGAHRAYSKMPFPVIFTQVPHNPEIQFELPGGGARPNTDFSWKGPARAWNVGFQKATGDLFYCISSEVVQDEGNVLRAKALGLAYEGEAAIFGACHNSTPENLVVGAEPGLLVSSKMTRPLGFIACIPAIKIREIEGFDEEFMKGFWYDDDDFYLRLWQSGVDFIFDDSIHGIHLDHPRPVLDTQKGMDGIATNRTYMQQKHNTINPWPTLPRSEQRKEGQTIWRHI
jgi:hypothetical protein